MNLTNFARFTIILIFVFFASINSSLCMVGEFSVKNDTDVPRTLRAKVVDNYLCWNGDENPAVGRIYWLELVEPMDVTIGAGVLNDNVWDFVTEDGDITGNGFLGYSLYKISAGSEYFYLDLRDGAYGSPSLGYGTDIDIRVYFDIDEEEFKFDVEADKGRIFTRKSGSKIPVTVWDLFDAGSEPLNQSCFKVPVTVSTNVIGLEFSVNGVKKYDIFTEMEFYSTDNPIPLSTVSPQIIGNNQYRFINWTEENYNFQTDEKSFEGEISDLENEPFTALNWERVYTAHFNYIDIIQPVGGEVFTSGDPVSITWENHNFNGNVKIECSYDGGGNWNAIEGAENLVNTGNAGTYDWLTDIDLNTANCQVKVSGLDTDDPYCISEPFLVIPPMVSLITLITPNGGERWQIDMPHTITWTNVNFDQNVNLEYSYNGGLTWYVINGAENLVNMGFYDWTASQRNTSTRYLIRVSDAVDGDPSDVSDGYFTMHEEVEILFDEPRAGYEWLAGSEQTIKFECYGLFPSTNLNIEYTLKDGDIWGDWNAITSILSTLPFEYEVDWIVPSAGGQLCKIKVYTDAGSPLAISDEFLIIGPDPIPPIVSITSPPDGATFTIPADIPITADASDSDGTVDKVEFFVNGSKLGSDDTSPPYEETWTGAQAGTYTLTAIATDNDDQSTTSDPVEIHVNPPTLDPPTITLTSPANGETFTEPATINMTANASDSDGSVAKVEFYNGSTKLGEDTSSPYAYTWSDVSAGTYTLKAKAIDNDGLITTSSSVGITVNPPALDPPTVTLTSPANGETFTEPATINMTANASDSDGSVAKVEFYNGSTKLGEDTSSPYAYTWSDVLVGIYTLKAKAIDNDGLSDISSVTVEVEEEPVPGDPPVVAITYPPDGFICYAPSDVTITADATDADGTVDRVQFYLDGTLLGEDTNEPFTLSTTFSTAGDYTLSAVTTDNDGITSSDEVSITVLSQSGQTPYGGVPWLVPGHVEFEDFDNGGEGVAFHDGTWQDNGDSPYHPCAVDIYSATTASNDNFVGEVYNGEWLEYTVQMEPGTYDIHFRFAAPYTKTGRVVSVKLDGQSLGDVPIPQTGGEYVWKIASLLQVTLPEGLHILRLDLIESGANFDFIEFVKNAPVSDNTRTPYAGVTHVIPGIIEAENYDEDGEGIAYHDTDPENLGGYYRSEGVDIDTTSDGNQYCITQIADGEYLEYTVDAAGNAYDLYARVASDVSTGQLLVKLGERELGTFDVPNTGSLSIWTTMEIEDIFVLDGDNQVLRLEMLSGGFKINWVWIAPIHSHNQKPFLFTPHFAPCFVEAEDFDDGGHNISFYDVTYQDYGDSPYHPCEVDIYTSATASNDNYVGYISAGEWLEYTMFAEEGVYDIRFRVSAKWSKSGRDIVAKVDGENKGQVYLPATGSDTNWTIVTIPDVTISGLSSHIVRFDVMNSGGNIDKIEFIKNQPLAKMSIKNTETIQMVDESVNLPKEFVLYNNHPNPFNPETTIKYDLPEASQVVLKVYNMMGREIVTLLNKQKNAGGHEVIWNGRDEYGLRVSSGIYILLIQAGKFNAVKKMVMVK